MIWLNPWAWLGIAGVVLPLVIHLLGRGHARVVRFPTLRFIDSSRLLPTKRSRIQDPLLLAVRVAIVAAAAIALAQPLLLTRGRRETLDRGIARAVIVDTSASVRRLSADSLNAVAAQLASQARVSVVVQTADPPRALAGAAAWVAKQQRSGEIAIVSDFQRGQLVREDLGAIPAAVGIVLRRVPVSRAESVFVQTGAAGRTQTAVAREAEHGVAAQWRASSDSSVRAPVELYGAAEEARTLAATQSAAAALPVPLPIDSARAIAIIFPRFAARDSILRVATPAKAAWKVALLSDIRRAGLSVVVAGDATVEGRSRFAIVTNIQAASLDAARLVALARQATSIAPSAAELELSTVPDSVLTTWERPAAPTSATARYGPTDADGPSDARWVWAIVLALLLVEWQLRRRSAGTIATAVERARAA